MFDVDFLRIVKDPKQIELLKSAYLKAEPFPHMIFDNVLSETTLWSMISHFPKPDASWWKYDNALERKFAKDNIADEHPVFQNTIGLLQSRQFTDFLEALTGIKALIVDQTLRGGGLHQIAKGGKLDIHADYNCHPITDLDRRINVLLYLNPKWDPNWGGALELWDKNMTKAVKSIDPVLGRIVVFSTTDEAYHGHPEPLNCPEGIMRRSIALYYYTNGRPMHEWSNPHSTLYQARPQDSKDPKTQELRDQRAKGRLT